jgi:hypothetical protein
MLKTRLFLLSLVLAAGIAGCALPGPTVARGGTAVEVDRGLVGAWIISANRASGVGKNLLTFSSDGTFFRSGDTHPVYSGGHGAWKRTGEREFDATYIAFTFDQTGKWIGSNKVRIHIVQGPGDNEFTAATKATILDLQDNVVRAVEGRLAGKRIQVEPF